MKGALVLLKAMLPLILSLMTAAPLIFFFKMFFIAEEISQFNTLVQKNRQCAYVPGEPFDNLEIFCLIRFYLFGYFAEYCAFVCFALKAYKKSPL